MHVSPCKERNSGFVPKLIAISLYELAYFGSVWNMLDTLAAFALPEPWKFKIPDCSYKNLDTPILERYLLSTYRHLAIDYTSSRTQEEAEKYIWVLKDHLCFNTGLMTPKYKYIYAYFEKNPRPDSMLEWKFRAFVDEASSLLKFVCPLPRAPEYFDMNDARCFDPQREIRINSEHILEDDENVHRLPERLQAFPNLPLLLEAAVEKSRRLAQVCPGIVAQQSYRHQLQYLLPLYLLGSDTPDLVLTLADEAGYYTGSTCLTLNMAYMNARLLGRPSALWLLSLVESKNIQ